MLILTSNFRMPTAAKKKQNVNSFFLSGGSESDDNPVFFLNLSWSMDCICERTLNE